MRFSCHSVNVPFNTAPGGDLDLFVSVNIASRFISFVAAASFRSLWAMKRFGALTFDASFSADLLRGNSV